METYSKEIEEMLCAFYATLSEKGKRHYSAIEAIKLGHGGITYIANLFGCSRTTIEAGWYELSVDDMAEFCRIRRPGGGRRTANENIFDLDETFLLVIQDHIAGDPMNEDIKWLKLTNYEIRMLLKKHGVVVGKNVVRNLLKKHKFAKRKMERKKSTGEFKDRDLQFRNIAKIKKEFQEAGNPILSIDTKKKEDLGDLARDGRAYTTKAIQAYDHDYPHLSEGKLVPHGIYDLARNEALITLGIQNETAQFISDALKKWWDTIGQRHYPTATSILVLCDAGGANSYRHHTFKFALQALANKIGMPIRICHYPPYASKWNPIEHRVFPHVTRTMEGVPLKSVSEAKDLIKKTKTKTGLNVVVKTSKKVYQTGIKVAKTALEKINITKHGKLKQLNYTIAPAVM